MMNLLVNRPLNQAEKQFVYELTLKKRKDKKCHMSASQMLARQQLARDLLPHLRMGPMDCEAVVAAAGVVNSACGGANSICSSLGSSGCSFSRSDSSYSGSSQSSTSNGPQIGADTVAASSDTTAAGTTDAVAELSRLTEIELEEETRQANIKLKKTRLEHLNEELDRRLYQYQYLVAQEKALLGTYNMMLFTNEGVGNFHLMRNVPLKHPDV